VRDVRERVFESLDNALANDALKFEGSGDLVDQIAIDLGTYDADLEGKEPAELRPHIVAWMASKPLIISIWAPLQVSRLA